MVKRGPDSGLVELSLTPAAGRDTFCVIDQSKGFAIQGKGPGRDATPHLAIYLVTRIGSKEKKPTMRVVSR
jgi:hypothetical protein